MRPIALLPNLVPAIWLGILLATGTLNVLLPVLALRLAWVVTFNRN